MLDLKEIEKLDFSKLTEEQKVKAGELIEQINIRKKKYPILDYKPQPYQQEFIDAVSARNPDGTPRYKFIIFMGGNGCGKCFGKGTKVLRYNGEVDVVENIRKGDLLLGPDSKPREVLGTTVGEEVLYRISPERDESFIVNESHILSLIQRRRDRKGRRKSNGLDYAPEGELVNISVKDYLSKSDKWKAESKIWRPKEVGFQKQKDPEICPYTFGLWIGDGTSTDASFTIGNGDPEIRDYIYDYADYLNLGVKQYGINGIQYRITNGVGTRNKLYSLLSGYGVLGNKHFPKDFLTSSKTYRLEILAGLIDSDGTKCGKGYSVTQKSERIADGAVFIARSLGLKVNKTSRIAKLKIEGEKDYECEVFNINIQGDCTKIPVLSPRKKIKSKNTRSDPLLTGFKIEKLEVGEYFGFELDKDHLFLDGNFRVQHNTQSFSYITQLIALGELTKDYGLPYIGKASQIKVYTTAGSNIKENIHPYILGTETSEDLLKIPGFFTKDLDQGELVKRVAIDKDILKQVNLVNGTKLYFGSYEQGQSILQGGSPDLTWIDEIPTRWADFREIIRGSRKVDAQVIMSFTPTNYNQKIYDWIYGGQDNKFIRTVNSLENKYADHSWQEGLSEDELRIVQAGEFSPPTGLVYKNFRRDDAVVPHISPKKLGTKVKYYGALDFGVKHPMAFLFIAVDEDGHTYVFDEIYKSGLLLSDLVKEVEDKKLEHGIEFEYVIADSAGARERKELAHMGLITKKAKKKVKENNMSNVRGGILKINQLLGLGKLIISDRCKSIIQEFQTFHYKEKGADGTVNKEGDDALDALRYFVFSYTEYSETKELKRTYKKRSRRANRR